VPSHSPTRPPTGYDLMGGRVGEWDGTDFLNQRNNKERDGADYQRKDSAPGRI